MSLINSRKFLFRDIHLEKTKFSLDGAIGHPYGTLFEVKDGTLVKMERVIEQDGELAEKG